MRGFNSLQTKLLVSMAIFACFLLATGCSLPKGSTPSEKRAYIHRMEKATLAELFAEHPALAERVKEVPGYGVFSNINTNIIFVSAGNGYGLVHDNLSGKDTYMRMGQVGIGLGLGLKDFRAVFIFKDRETLTRFLDKGFEFGAHADATAVSGDRGGELTGAASADSDIEIYQFTEAGIALQATIAGTKYWVDKDLN